MTKRSTLISERHEDAKYAYTGGATRKHAIPPAYRAAHEARIQAELDRVQRELAELDARAKDTRQPSGSESTGE